MAREYARLLLRAWGDTEWRSLTMGSQWLYEHLLSSPNLSYAGVADWRPGRIAKMCSTANADLIEQGALGLEQKLMLIIDRDTEEALVRSYLRNDSIMSQPNLAIAACKAWQNTASEVLRSVIAYEMERLDYEHSQTPPSDKKAFSQGVAFDNPSARQWIDNVLSSELLEPSEAIAALEPNPYDPSVHPSDDPSDDPSVHPLNRGTRRVK